MIFKRTVLSGLVAELPPEVWTSDEVERRLAPLYGRLKLPEGRLELMTGIRERRFWPQAIRPSAVSALAGRRAMQAAGVGPTDIDLLIHSSVCRDRLEPSTAAYLHGLLGLGRHTASIGIGNTLCSRCFFKGRPESRSTQQRQNRIGDLRSLGPLLRGCGLTTVLAQLHTLPRSRPGRNFKKKCETSIS